MRRAIVIALLACCWGSALNPATAGSRVKDPSVQCRYKRAGGWSDADVKATIKCAEHRWSVPGGSRKAISVARCESGFNEHSRYVGHLGVYQHVARYWPARFRHWRVRRWHMHPSALNARSNVVISMRMVHTGGWGPWSCA